jgi:hypothetical protein
MKIDESCLEKAYSLLIKDKRQICIFIYCPPKVGSTTLVSSFRMVMNKVANVIHIHNEVMLEVLTGIKNIKVVELIEYIATKVEKMYVIDIYRTPIERKMSEYFDKLTFHFNNTEDSIKQFGVDRIIDRFNKIYPFLEYDDYYSNTYNIDTPIGFNYEDKYIMNKKNNINYLKLRLMDSNEWPKILSKIFCREIIIIEDYLTEDKVLGKKYKEFKDNYLLPYNFYNDLCKDSANLTKYLSSDECMEYLDKWKGKLGLEVTPFTGKEYQLYLSITIANQHYDKIEINHYIDNGCSCKACSEKRYELLLSVKNGKRITDKIIHEECVSVYKNKLNKKIRSNAITLASSIANINTRDNTATYMEKIDQSTMSKLNYGHNKQFRKMLINNI